jgi:nitrite reductase (NADH) large subunit
LCVGGGLLGLETAGALARRGADVLILESHSYLMPNQLDSRAAALLAKHVSAAGVALRTNARLRELCGGQTVAEAVLTDGAVLPAELVVLAVGVRSDTYLARGAGLDVKRGVTADNRLRTTHPDVFVAGDAAEHAGQLYGNWFVAHKQGEIAGRNAAGGDVEFSGLPRSHTLKVLNVGVTGIGRFLPVDGADWAVSAETADGGYHSFVFRDGLMVGANLLGHDHLAAIVKCAVESRWDFTALLKRGPSAADVVAHLQERD